MLKPRRTVAILTGILTTLGFILFAGNPLITGPNIVLGIGFGLTMAMLMIHNPERVTRRHIIFATAPLLAILVAWITIQDRSKALPTAIWALLFLALQVAFLRFSKTDPNPYETTAPDSQNGPRNLSEVTLQPRQPISLIRSFLIFAPLLLYMFVVVVAAAISQSGLPLSVAISKLFPSTAILKLGEFLLISLAFTISVVRYFEKRECLNMWKFTGDSVEVHKRGGLIHTVAIRDIWKATFSGSRVGIFTRTSPGYLQIRNLDPNNVRHAKIEYEKRRQTLKCCPSPQGTTSK